MQASASWRPRSPCHGAARASLPGPLHVEALSWTVGGCCIWHMDGLHHTPCKLYTRHAAGRKSALLTERCACCAGPDSPCQCVRVCGGLLWVQAQLHGLDCPGAFRFHRGVFHCVSHRAEVCEMAESLNRPGGAHPSLLAALANCSSVYSTCSAAFAQAMQPNETSLEITAPCFRLCSVFTAGFWSLLL